jgi:hypothetical protein
LLTLAVTSPNALYPNVEKVAKRRAAVKDLHWVQAVRRGHLASIGDYPVPKAKRAPVVPEELKVAEQWHVPFAVENAQAVRGAYGVQVKRIEETTGFFALPLSPVESLRKDYFLFFQARKTAEMN